MQQRNEDDEQRLAAAFHGMAVAALSPSDLTLAGPLPRQHQRGRLSGQPGKPGSANREKKAKRKAARAARRRNRK